MQILNGRSKIVTRIISAQILMLVFGLSVTLPTMQNTLLKVGANILSAGLYFFLIYTFMHGEGQRDAVKAGREPASDPLKAGVAVMLAANSLNILLLVIYSVGQLIRAITETSTASDTFVGIIDTALYILYGVFLGFSSLLNRGGSTNPLIYAAYILIPIIVGIIGYRNGLRGISILEKMGLSSDENKDKPKK
ncbi:MAG: hypothetical protein AB9835_04485 [Eubacteriales bacterium]